MFPEFKVIIAGSRSFHGLEYLTYKCDKVLSSKVGTHEIVVVSGGALGADTLGEEYAKLRGFRVAQFLADWDRLGKKAGMVRNKEMGDYADALIAFWDGESRGTKQMIEYMRGLGKPVRVFFSDRTTPERITELGPKDVFVFGSNLSGFHGKGAAFDARKWGAVHGEYFGHVGRTYAIPTKSARLDTLPMRDIIPYTNEFVLYAQANPDLRFLVTGVGTGLAGIPVVDMARRFEGLIHTNNVTLPGTFWSAYGVLGL